MHHASLFISLPSLHDYDVKMPNFTFMDDVNKGIRNFDSLVSKLSAVSKKSTPEKFDGM